MSSDSNPQNQLAVAAMTLDAMGVDPADLAAYLEGRGPAPSDSRQVTFAEYVPVALDALRNNTRRAYRPPLRFIAEGWSVPADEVADVARLATELELNLRIEPDEATHKRCGRLPVDERMKRRGADDHRLLFAGWGDEALQRISEAKVREGARWIRLRAAHTNAKRAARREENGRYAHDHDGRGAEETYIAAMRCLFKLAGGDPDIAISKSDNPAKDIEKPPRKQSPRRMLTDDEVAEAWEVTRTRGDDPELDALLFRFHIISGARREGALNLRLRDLCDETARVFLREKNQRHQWQPVSPSLVEDLRVFAMSRGATGRNDKVFRYLTRPITGRRYDYWLENVQEALPWADRIGFDAHTLRHHAGSVIERIAGRAVSQAFLRHTPTAVTDGYTVASEAEVAAAVARMTGERHPLAGG